MYELIRYTVHRFTYIMRNRYVIHHAISNNCIKKKKNLLVEFHKIVELWIRQSNCTVCTIKHACNASITTYFCVKSTIILIKLHNSEFQFQRTFWPLTYFHINVWTRRNRTYYGCFIHELLRFIYYYTRYICSIRTTSLCIFIHIFITHIYSLYIDLLNGLT